MKKTLSAIMALVIALSCMMGLGLTTLAANDPGYTVSFNKQDAHRSDEVVMEIGIQNNPGFITLRFQIAYDQDALTLEKVEDTQLLRAGHSLLLPLRAPISSDGRIRFQL